MAKQQHILISLASRFADAIFAGKKSVELRRRKMDVAPGSTVWIYVKLPVGSIVGKARVEAVHASSPTSLWKRFGVMSGLSKTEFFEYFRGVTRGFALVLEGATRLRKSLPLEVLRQSARKFNPPQFFLKLPAEHPILSAVTSRPTG